MTSASMTNLTDESHPRPLISREGWLWIGLLVGLFAVLHWSFLYRMWRIATSDNNWSHALVVPLIAGYYVFQQRVKLATRTTCVCWWGVPIMLLGLYGYAAGIYPIQNDMAQGYSMILMLFGLTLFLLGGRMISILWFPIVYLVFAVKVSDRIWSQIAAQLQWVAAKCSTVALQLIAVFMPRLEGVENRGSTIDLTFWKAGNLIQEPINVAEACAGLRMLMAFLAMGVALAWLWERPWWQRIVMVLMAVPIAVSVNVGRVTVIGVLYTYNKDLATGDFHTFVGMIMLIPAAFLFLLIGWILDQIIVSNDAPARPPAPSATDRSEPQQPISRGLVSIFIVIGVLIVLASGAVYITMQQIEPPNVTIPSVPVLLTRGAISLIWLLLPPAIMGSIIGLTILPRLMPTVAESTRQVRIALATTAAAAIMATSFVGQSAVIAKTKMVLHKKAVPLRHHLYKMADVHPWVLHRSEPPLSAELLDELGTRDYITNIYEDTQWPKNQPGRFVRLHVPYYTGTADTVPHVPERCFTAGGAEYQGKSIEVIDVQGPEYQTHDGKTLAFSELLMDYVSIPDTQIRATQFRYTFGSLQSNVIYFFAANGKFLPGPDHVRAQGFDPHDGYAYYCKIELMPGRFIQNQNSNPVFIGIADEQLARQRAESFLAAMLPEIMACLPDWTEVQTGRWPSDRAAIPAPNPNP